MTKYDMKSRKKSAAQNLDAYDILKVNLKFISGTTTVGWI